MPKLPVDSRPSFIKNAEKVIIHPIGNGIELHWYSLARNWLAEYNLRMQTGITDPYINPDTNIRYSNNAQRYRNHYTKEKLVCFNPNPNRTNVADDLPPSAKAGKSSPPAHSEG